AVRDPRVVDQAVDRAVFVGEVVAQCGPVLLRGDVVGADAGRFAQVEPDHDRSGGRAGGGLGGALTLRGPGDDHDLAVQIGHDVRSASRCRAGGTGTGSTPGTMVLRRVPRASTVSVTTSPGLSGGGVWVPLRPHSSARQPPLPQVPEPSRSPGRTQVPREA